MPLVAVLVPGQRWTKHPLRPSIHRSGRKWRTDPARFRIETTELHDDRRVGPNDRCKSSSSGMGKGSIKSLKRTTRNRRGSISNVYGPTQSRSV
jgi:hypothetical protein